MDGIIAKLTSEKFSEISSLTSENMAATVVDVDGRIAIVSFPDCHHRRLVNSGEAGGLVDGHEVACFRVTHLGGSGPAASVVAGGDPEPTDATGGRAAEVGRDHVHSLTERPFAERGFIFHGEVVAPAGCVVVSHVVGGVWLVAGG